MVVILIDDEEIISENNKYEFGNQMFYKAQQPIDAAQLHCAFASPF
jgi:hypothetical protein